MIRFLPVALLATLMATTTPAMARPITAQPDKSWHGFEIKAQAGGELVVFLGTVAVNGRIAICGIGHTRRSNALFERLVPGIISDMRIVQGGRQLVLQPDDFRLYPSAEAMAKGKAGCTLTRHAADPASLRQPLRVEARTGYSSDW
jgi:hypothetical protein